jgi:hypothetical protein
VDLDHPYLLATGGLDPDKSDPQFHQQMVYAVLASLLETLDNLRGRRLVWRNVWRSSPDGPGVRPMPVFPHRITAANAFYAPGEGLSFGSFAAADDPELLVPGQWVPGCLSHRPLRRPRPRTRRARRPGLHVGDRGRPRVRVVHGTNAAGGTVNRRRRPLHRGLDRMVELTSRLILQGTA